MPGETTLGGGGRRTKVMDGSWNPRRVNCWPLHVRLGDTLALPRLRKSMHPFVHSRATNPLGLSPSSFCFTYTITNTIVAVANLSSTCSLLFSFSRQRQQQQPLFLALEKGELGGVGDVRLLHYVFLTEPPLTSTLSPSRTPSFPFCRSFHPQPFSVLSRCSPSFHVSPLTENENPPHR